MSRFDAGFGFSVGTSYSSSLVQDAEHAEHCLGLAAPQEASWAEQGSWKCVNWLMGQQLFLR